MNCLGTSKRLRRGAGDFLWCLLVPHCVCCNIFLSRQRIVGPGQIPADECVIFMKDVAKGAAVEMDYGTIYMLSPEIQMYKYKDSEVERLLHAVMKQLGPRVMRVFEKFMCNGV